MAMRTASPWWASLAFGVGLLFFMLGERFFGHLVGPRFVLTGIGLVLMLAITAARVWTTLSSSGPRRKVERTLLICHVATLFALVLYVLSSEWGQARFKLDDTSAAHFHGALTALYAAVLIGSLVPLLMVELSLGLALRTTFDVRPSASGVDGEEGVEYFRVREIGWSGLSVGLALSFLMVTCQVASERNAQTDVSYFKTSSPGESTRKIVSLSSDAVRVLLFFPEVNPVKDQVKSYFDALAAATGKLKVELRDRLSDAELAGKFKVVKDGTIVLIRGTGDNEKSQNLDIDTELSRARVSTSKLRNLDREVNTVLLKLMRDKRKAYLSVGHGEINDPDSIPAELKGANLQRRNTTVLKRRLADLNYEVKNLSLLDLAKDIPADATLVAILGPSLPLQGAEWATLERYLDRGGRLLLAVDPRGVTDIGPLSPRLALKVLPGHLTDDVQFMRQRGTMTDRRFAMTNQFSAHASTGTLSRTSSDRGIILIDAAALDDLPYTGKSELAPKKTITIRSLDTSFLDLNDNYAFDAATEKKQRWNIAASIEGAKVTEEGAKRGEEGYRMLLFADVDLFADALFQDAMGRPSLTLVSGPLLEDSIKWLGGDEAIVGDVVSEDDRPIQHTKSEDAVWFMMMIIGAPIIVLTLGLVGTWARRRRGSKKAEVTQ